VVEASKPQTQNEKNKTKTNRRKTMANRILNLNREEYVRNARNQLQEDKRILFYLPRCREFFDGLVQDNKES
jgi:hypothetical protein